MLDIKFIRENPDALKHALQNRGVKFDVDYFIELDERRRRGIKEIDDLRMYHNRLSLEVAHIHGHEREKKIDESREIKERLFSLESSLKTLENEFTEFMYRLPNTPLTSVPVGEDECANVVLREVGKKPKLNFRPLDYTKVATRLNLVDTERAGKVSGSRFGYLKNEAVLLEFALVQLAFEQLQKHHFIPMIPPVMIKEEMMHGMGYIDSEKDREERYFLERDKLYLVGTSEQSIAPMHQDEIFDEEELPKRYVGFSTCFRREAGSYGKDTHGILRVHQFDKVEMVSFTRPEESEKEHEFLLSMEEILMQELGIPYRVVQLSTGDLSQPSAATYDIESWLPGQNNGEGEYRETHSVSNTTDFQARRLGTRVRTKDGLQPVHILNGTAFAIGRMLIAILENYQQEDGSVEIPEALQKYMGGIKEIRRS